MKAPEITARRRDFLLCIRNGLTTVREIYTALGVEGRDRRHALYLDLELFRLWGWVTRRDALPVNKYVLTKNGQGKLREVHRQEAKRLRAEYYGV